MTYVGTVRTYIFAIDKCRNSLHLEELFIIGCGQLQELFFFIIQFFIIYPMSTFDRPPYLCLSVNVSIFCVVN